MAADKAEHLNGARPADPQGILRCACLRTPTVKATCSKSSNVQAHATWPRVLFFQSMDCLQTRSRKPLRATLRSLLTFQPPGTSLLRTETGTDQPHASHIYTAKEHSDGNRRTPLNIPTGDAPPTAQGGDQRPCPPPLGHSHSRLVEQDDACCCCCLANDTPPSTPQM